MMDPDRDIIEGVFKPARLKSAALKTRTIYLVLTPDADTTRFQYSLEIPTPPKHLKNHPSKPPNPHRINPHP